MSKQGSSLVVTPYAGDNKTLLTFNFTDKGDAHDLAGFSIKCSPPPGGLAPYYLYNDLTFANPAAHAQVATEKPASSVNSPFQKYRWTHVPGTNHQGIVTATGPYTYAVTPRYFDSHGSMQALDASLTRSVTISVAPFRRGSLALGFSRGYIQSGAFVHHFGPKVILRPSDDSLIFDTAQRAGTSPDGVGYTYADMYSWSGGTARQHIFSILDGVVGDKRTAQQAFRESRVNPAAIVFVSILLALFAPLSVRASEASAQGRWATLLANALYICKNRDMAWTWTNAGDYPQDSNDPAERARHKTVISLIDSQGTVLKSNEVDYEFSALAVTHDCQTVWGVDVDGQKILWIDRYVTDPVGLAAGTDLSDGIKTLFVSEDHVHAWLRFQSDKPIASLEWTPQGIVTKEIANGAALAGELLMQTAYHGDRIAILPKDTGLWMADRTRTWPVTELSKVNVITVDPSAAGHVLWAIPSGKGLYAVDQDGRPLRNKISNDLLPNVDVSEVLAGPNTSNASATRDYCWISSRDRLLYLIKLNQDGNGSWSTTLFNGGQPIAEPDGGPVLHVDDLNWVGDGSSVWARTTSGSWSSHINGLWRVFANADGSVRVMRIDPQLYESKNIRSVFADDPRPDLIWVRTSDYVLYEIDVRQHKSLKDPFNGMVVQNIFSSNRPDRVWAVTAMGDYLLGPAADLLPKTDIEFNGRAVDKNYEFHSQSDIAKASVRIQLPVISAESPRDVKLSVVKNGIVVKESEVVASAAGRLDEHGRANIDMFIRSKMTPLSRYDVTLSYGDQRFINAEMKWSGIPLSLPWYEWPYAIALFLLLAPIIILVLALQHAPAMSRWIPIAVTLIETGVARFDENILKLDSGELLTTALVSFVVVFAAALWSPTIFRIVAPLQPYRAVVPFVLQMGPVRKRFFKGYLADLAGTVERIRQQALNESYSPVPCRVLDSHSPAAPELDISAISERISAADSDRRQNVLIEAPGGRGKSALLNELLRRAIHEFAANAYCPLPVLGNLSGKTLDEAITAGLGRFRVCDDFISAGLFAGEITFFVDGLSENGSDPALLETYLKSPVAGERFRICASSRPAASWHSIFASSDRWTIIAPERLTDRTIDEFVRTYSESQIKAGSGRVDMPIAAKQAKETAAPGSVSGPIKALRVARAFDGTYLPLLVRFAMLAAEEKVDTIADLFAAVLDRLLERAGDSKVRDELRKAAMDLAMQSYWRSGERVIDCNHVSDQTAELVHRLLDVGVLIDGENKMSRLRTRPKRVRFVHDSMQSYLVACALGAQGDWSVLQRVAGAPEFAPGKSDIIAGESSELFDMCLHIFKPISTLRDWLKDALLTLAHQHGSALSIDQITVLLAQSDSAAIHRINSENETTRDYLTNLVAQAMREEDSAAVDLFGRLYGSLQRCVWKRPAGKAVQKLDEEFPASEPQPMAT